MTFVKGQKCVVLIEAFFELILTYRSIQKQYALSRVREKNILKLLLIICHL